jgi:hypothetical protein
VEIPTWVGDARLGPRRPARRREVRVAVSSPSSPPAATSYLGGNLFLLAFLASRRREHDGELEVAGCGGGVWLDDDEGATLAAAHGTPDLDGGRPRRSRDPAAALTRDPPAAVSARRGAGMEKAGGGGTSAEVEAD